MSAIKRFEEMDRVEFKAAGGRMVYGTVTEASGDAVRLVTDGGRYRLRVPARRLSFSSRAVRRDLPSAMDVWQVADFADDAGADSTKYSAIITLHGGLRLGFRLRGHGLRRLGRLRAQSGDLVGEMVLPRHVVNP